MALDGFVLDVADTLANEAPSAALAVVGAFPDLRLLAQRDRQPCAVALAARPLPPWRVRWRPLQFLEKDMLLYWDRNFLEPRDAVIVLLRRRATWWPGISSNRIFVDSGLA